MAAAGLYFLFEPAAVRSRSWALWHRLTKTVNSSVAVSFLSLGLVGGGFQHTDAAVQMAGFRFVAHGKRNRARPKQAKTGEFKAPAGLIAVRVVRPFPV